MKLSVDFKLKGTKQLQMNEFAILYYGRNGVDT